MTYVERCEDFDKTWNDVWSKEALQSVVDREFSTIALLSFVSDPKWQEGIDKLLNCY